jgi:tetratricopeptide (TPR) repeat protein
MNNENKEQIDVKMVDYYVEKNFEYIPNPMLSEQIAKKKFKLEYLNSLNQDGQRITHGFKLILAELKLKLNNEEDKSLAEKVNISIKSFFHNIGENLEIFTSDTKLESDLLDSKTIGELLGFDPEVIDLFFDAAENLFQKGLFKDSRDAFLFLHQLNPIDFSILFYVAFCEEKMENYQEAIHVYERAIPLQATNPLPYIQMAYCSKKLKQPKAWEEYLEQADKLIQNDKIFDELYDDINEVKKL